MRIYIPSYKRAGQVSTADFFEGFDYQIVIPMSQYADYLKFYDEKHLLVIPDELDGNVSKKRNAIMDIMKNEDGYGIVADDDLLAIKHIMHGYSLDASSVMNLFENMMEICFGIGAHLCGFNNTNDKLKYRGDFVPFSLTKPFYQIFGIVECGLRYDESLRRGEDVDFYFHQMLKHRKVVRDNRFHVVVNEKNKDTGIGMTDEYCVEDNIKVQKRWGKKLVRLYDNGVIKGVSQPLKGG